MKRIFICFDFDNDRHYAYLLTALAQNPNFSLNFENRTPGEVQSTDVARIKAALTRRIKSATHTLVVVGQHANSLHALRSQIGEDNWQHWEIVQSINEGKKLIGVKIERHFIAPRPMLNRNATWAHSYNVPAITAAIDQA